MPITNVTTAGTRVALTASTTKCARLTIQRKAANTGAIFIGLPGADNSENAVSSTVYDLYLDANNTSVTLGMGETMADSVDPNRVWLDSAVNGEGVAWFMETI